MSNSARVTKPILTMKTSENGMEWVVVQVPSRAGTVWFVRTEWKSLVAQTIAAPDVPTTNTYPEDR